MPRNLFSVNTDLQPAMDAIGTVAGISETVESQFYAESIIKTTFAYGEKEFGVYMDALAASNPSGFHHVYEWNMIGVSKARLWKLVLHGRGGTRTMEFSFKPSMTKVPKPKIKIPGWTPKAYRFSAKAAVMEFGIPVTITPKREGGRLIIPFPNGDGYTTKTGQNYIMSDGPIEVKNPGGNVAGNFVAAYVAFWNQRMPDIFDERVRPRIEKDIRNVATKGFAYAGRKARRGKVGKRNVNLTIGTAQADAQQALLRAAAQQAREAAIGGD